MSINIKEKYNLPQSLTNQDDLDTALNIFYSEEVQSTDLKYLRFGQFIYNIYNIEIDNSYNIKDPYLVYKLILDYIKIIN